MLVCVWEAMDAAIPRIEAAEHLSAYTVAVVAGTHAEESSRDSILSAWRKLVLGGKPAPAVASEPHSVPGQYLEDGTRLKRLPNMPLKKVIEHIKTAFGRAIRD